MKRTVPVLLWVLSFFLTVAVVVYQRMTGPTYPIRNSEVISGQKVSYRFLRSHTSFELLPVRVAAEDESVTGSVKYRRYKSGDEWSEIPMKREGGVLTAWLPSQPSAGKIEYSVRLEHRGKELVLNKGRTVVARFKNEVPPAFLIMHVIFMVLGFLFAIRTGLEALRKNGRYLTLVNWTLAIVFIGGIILGPIVQKYAFGDFWTGIPFGTDLTDNKTLAAFIFWVAAFLLKKRSRWWVFAATVMMIIVYLIPHSTMGSELDYTTGQMKNKFSGTGVYSIRSLMS